MADVQTQDMADMAEKVLAAQESDPEALQAAAEAIHMTPDALVAMAQYSISTKEADEKRIAQIQKQSAMRRVLIAPAAKAGGDHERRLRVTTWNQVRKTEQYTGLRARLSAAIELLVVEFAEEGENAVANTRILVEQGVVELRGKDRKTDEDDE
ncbi:hypothetical protein LCGC14_0347690 [marine sediment metagenome]|uniref:Uncharacterized protein n=1 Tax=marine sediment metagenome TaxID=412755 RepID=A0A0F9TUR0_9ZZZZ